MSKSSIFLLIVFQSHCIVTFELYFILLIERKLILFISPYFSVCFLLRVRLSYSTLFLSHVTCTLHGCGGGGSSSGEERGGAENVGGDFKDSFLF